jgi:hypothetical protein
MSLVFPAGTAPTNCVREQTCLPQTHKTFNLIRYRYVIHVEFKICCTKVLSLYVLRVTLRKVSKIQYMN